MVFINFLKNLSTREHEQQPFPKKLTFLSAKFIKGQTNRIQERNLVLFQHSEYLSKQQSCVKGIKMTSFYKPP